MGDSFKNSALHKELLDKYISIKRSRRRKKRVPANTWITAEKLPSGYTHKRRKPPKIDDDDELDTALSSIEMSHCSSTNLDDSKNQLKEITTTTQITNTPLVLDDFDVADIDDNVLLDCLLTNLEDINFIMEPVDIDSIKFEQSQPNMTDSQQLDILNEIFKEHDFNFISTTTTCNQEFVNLQLNNFTAEPPQESVLSSTSPFPSSMSSPSIPSTSPNQQSQPQSDDNQVSDLTSSSSSSPSPPLPRPFPSPPSPAYPSTSSCPLSSCLPSQTPQTAPVPPPRPSYGKDIFLLLNDKTNQSDSSDNESETESDY